MVRTKYTVFRSLRFLIPIHDKLEELAKNNKTDFTHETMKALNKVLKVELRR